MVSLFNVRVYGILIENGKILVSDEIHSGRLITKFPGGGLQFGEGTIDCLKREFREELDISIEIESHFYTVDFFQPSAFDPTQQIVSIYYKIVSNEAVLINTEENKIIPQNLQQSNQWFRWLKIRDLNEDEFTFPIDKQVSKLIFDLFQNRNN